MLPLEAMIPETNDGGERVHPLAKREASGDAAELRDLDGLLRDSAERSEGDDRSLSNGKGRIGVGVGGGGSRVDELNDEIGPGARRLGPIRPVIWRETGVRVVVLSRSVSERRRRASRAIVGAVGGSGGKRPLTISGGSSTVGRRK